MEQVVPTTYFIASEPSAINRSVLSSLPSSFVMKGTAGSGQTLISHNGTHRCHGFACAGRAARQAQSGSPEEQIAFLQKVCRGWQSIDFGHLTKQRRFRVIKRQCIFEEFIPFNSDYKVFTLGGKPLLIQVDTSRYQGHRKGYYTPRWQPIPLMERHRRSNTILESGGASGGAGGTRHDIFARSKSGKRFISAAYKYGKLDFIARPVALDTMLREATSIATQLGLRMLRVDFYTATDGALWLGELTPSHDNCLSVLVPDIAAKWFSFAVTHTAEAAKDPEYADRIIRLLNASQSQACDPARRDRTREGAAHHANEPVELRDRAQEATTHHTTKPMDGLRTAMERANAMVMENLEEAMAQAQRAEAKVATLEQRLAVMERWVSGDGAMVR